MINFFDTELQPKPLDRLGYIELNLYDKLTDEIQGDLGYHFDQMPETASLDESYLKLRAASCIATEYKAHDPEEDEVLMEVWTRDNKGEKQTLAIMMTDTLRNDQALIHQINSKFPGADIILVPSDEAKVTKIQDLYLGSNRYTDKLTEDYNNKKNTLCEHISLTLYSVMFISDCDIPVEVHPFCLNDKTYDKISHHYNERDRKYYYTLFSVDGQKTVGMQEYKVIEYLTRQEPDQIQNTLNAFSQTVNDIKSRSGKQIVRLTQHYRIFGIIDSTIKRSDVFKGEETYVNQVTFNENREPISLKIYTGMKLETFPVDKNGSIIVKNKSLDIITGQVTTILKNGQSI